jgi:protein-disulfide isomerase
MKISTPSGSVIIAGILLASLTAATAQTAKIKKVSAKGQAAKTEAPSPEKVAQYVRERFGMPSTYKVTPGSLEASAAPGYYQVQLTTDDGKQTRQQIVTISKDGHYLLVGPLVALNGDVDAAIVQQLRDQFRLPPSETLTPGPLHASKTPGFLVTTVTATMTGSTGPQTQNHDFFVTDDKKFLAIGDIYDFTKDPRKEALRVISLKDSPTQGPANAPVTIVEFADLECPSCAHMHQFLEDQLLPKYGDKVRVVFKEFPLVNIHQWAVAGAVANECAYKIDPSKFVAYRSLIFQHQTDVDAVQANSSQVRDLLLGYGQQVGLDRGKLAPCFDGQESKSRVDEGKHEGDELSVNQTPTFYINGKILAGGAPPDIFYQAVDDALKNVK